MVSKKSSRGPVSQISSAASTATASTTQAANKSPIFRSSFSPSQYQLALFASVIQGLDSQHLRIHDTLTGRLRCDHAIASKATINSIDWGYYSGKHRDLYQQQAKKKRKRSEQINGEVGSDVVVAFGTSDSDIQMFSPAEIKVVGILQGAHTQGVRDFKFTNGKASAEGWSLGGDGKLAQWNLRTGTSTRQVLILSIPTISATTLARPVPTNPSVICASHTAYIIDPDSIGIKQAPAFQGSSNPIQTLITSSPFSSRLPGTFLAAAESDRFMNVFDVKKGRLVGSLIAENDVQSVAFYAGGEVDEKSSGGSENQEDQDQNTQVLAAVTRDGVVELFPRPFQGFEPTQSPGTSSSLKTKRKQMTRKNEALVKISRPDKSSTIVHVIDASFQEADMVMAWTEAGVNLVFERVRWKDESTGELLLKGVIEIVRGKSGSGLGATVMNGVKDLGKSKVDESQAVVIKGEDLEVVQMKVDDQDVIDVSSGDDDSSNEDALSEGEGEQAKDTNKATPDDDEEMKDAEHDDDQVEDAGEATFGDLVRANAPKAIDVSAAFEDAESKTLVQSSANNSLQLPSGMSLGTVLTQSLKTNDTTLLETCFHTTDLGTIRATIERLDSALAAALLQKLAERLHSRPGRAGNLMVWIQWTLICHGGYLATQPELMKKLSSLHKVVKQRASSLQPLLSLKGKLDMLEAQMNLRRTMQSNARAAHADDEDDEEGVIYVEGQDESDSEAESAEAAPKRGIPGTKRNGQSVDLEVHESKDISESEDDDDDMPTTLNGVVPDSEEEDESDSEDDIIDDEASETDEDSGDDISGDEVNHEDVDSADDDEESDVEAPPAKRTSKLQLGNGLFSKR